MTPSDFHAAAHRLGWERRIIISRMKVRQMLHREVGCYVPPPSTQRNPLLREFEDELRGEGVEEKIVIETLHLRALTDDEEHPECPPAAAQPPADAAAQPPAPPENGEEDREI